MSPRLPSPEKRDAILEAALDLFVERGFHGATVPQVAERAGVGAGTIYRYFDSKEALVNALYQRCKQSLISHLLEDFPFTAPAREQFHVFWWRMAEQARTDFQAMVFMELHHHGTYLDETSRSLEQLMLGTSQQVVARWRADQVVKDVEPALLIALIWGAFVGLQKSCWLDHLALSDETLAQAEACVWEAIRR